MARAETVGENGGGGNGPLPCHNTCRLEVPQNFHTWPGQLTTRTPRSGTSVSAPHLQNSPRHTEPLRALCLSNLLHNPHPEGQGEAHTHQQSPALSSSLIPSHRLVKDESSRRTVSPSDLSGEQPGKNLASTPNCKNRNCQASSAETATKQTWTETKAIIVIRTELYAVIISELCGFVLTNRESR
ncbi:hypothetical protein XENORESO_006808 [Xenotaenia resolanae]|uniref:Uncharacterized protein n=1 Tax=Xenotaenia resolanae TaxID=208358 RepID=A0ABV0X790_9TELE